MPPQTDSASQSMAGSIVMTHRPVDEPSQQCGDGHPSQLIPVEEGKAEQLRQALIVERDGEQAEEWQQQQQPDGPKCRQRAVFHLLVLLMRGEWVCPDINAILSCDSMLPGLYRLRRIRLHRDRSYGGDQYS